jgi:hypothetical protein
MKADDVKRIKELEKENQNSEATVADQALQVRALSDGFAWRRCDGGKASQRRNR